MRSEAAYVARYVCSDPDGVTINEIEIMIDGKPNEPRDGQAFVPWSSIALVYYAPENVSDET